MSRLQIRAVKEPAGWSSAIAKEDMTITGVWVPAVPSRMMPRSPRVTGDQTVRALLKSGWTETRRAGSHAILRPEHSPSRRVTVPVHAGKILKPKTLASILRQAGITMEEFRSRL